MLLNYNFHCSQNTWTVVRNAYGFMLSARPEISYPYFMTFGFVVISSLHLYGIDWIENDFCLEQPPTPHFPKWLLRQANVLLERQA